MKIAHALFAVSFAAALASCAAAKDEEGPGSSAAANEPAAAPPGTLRVLVRAASATTSSAPLVVAPYASCPPAGPPVGLKFVRLEGAVLPTTVDLTGLPPGRYHALAYRGVGMQPAASDPQVCSADDAALTATAGATLEVVLR